MHAPPAPVFEFGDFRLNPVRRVLQRRDGTVLPLTPRVFDTLLYMVENHDSVLDKERIMEAVWPDSIVEENNLSQNISTLRRLFGETPGSHQFIVTVPGRGYRFVASVKAVDGAVAQSLLNGSGGKIVAGTPAKDEVLPECVLPAAVRDRNRFSRAAIVVAALAFAIGAALLYWRSSTRPPQSPNVFAREKSIAVLPFTNLSDDKQNAYFAVAVQDEILTNLAQIADLKVISRMSADRYPADGTRNARDIGRELGVAHLVEGSVQRIGDHVRVHAQLIDTHTDSHLWAQTYDRELRDIFTLENDIATTIAEQLRAKISPGEKAAIEQPSTTDVVASTLYAEALPLKNRSATRQRAVELLEEAVARDPQFVSAYCELVKCHVLFYFENDDHTEARLHAANAALQSAMRLQPQAGAVHLAAADYAYLGLLDYDRARAELELARRTLPNSPEVYLRTGQIDRRQGRWTESLRNLERAVQLDPRDPMYTTHLAVAYQWLRRYRDAERLFDLSAALFHPAETGSFEAAFEPLYERADLTRVRAETSRALSQGKPSLDELERICQVAVLERDAARMEQVLPLLPDGGVGLGYLGVSAPREWFSALAASVRNDNAAAQAQLQVARERASAAVQREANMFGVWVVLSRIDAALGRHDEAIHEAQRACELLPVSKDAMYGPVMVTNLALVYAAVSEKDRAFEQLTTSAQLPGGVHYGELKLDPAWDALRGDPRFDQIVASLAPK
ncbi:MAG: winged helix-turn-helix domain-containing protein [Chthoniobacterales bacterium]